MQQITIDQEFRDLLPALDQETYKALEENLIQNGCRDSLVLWNGILIDGHNRYEICVKHDIPFTTVEKVFASREEALIWIISTQVSRRNLTPIQLSHFRGLHYAADKKILSNESGKNQYIEVEEQNVPQPKNQSTAERLGKRYKVSSMTIKRDAKVAEAISAIGEVSPAAKSKILSGEINIDKSELKKLSAMPREDIEAIAVDIESGTYEKKKSAAQTPSGQESSRILVKMAPLNTAIGKISNVFQAELPKIATQEERSQVKTTLRSYIDTLEDLYKQI
ncbi:MAG: hypothetical protein LBB91_08875 [Clostridiales bacterium]|jgi:hypothetical protein|nr:hypothetical protein [Clostridiales bacterium]